MPQGKKRTSWRVFLVGGVAALAGLLFGLDIGVISGVLPWLEKAWHISALTEETIVSVLLLGAFAGSIFSGLVVGKFGRRNTLLCSAGIFFLGAFASALASGPVELEAVRFFLGVGVGIASYAAPLYLSEISPQHVRGAQVSMYQLMITIGILMAFMSDTLLGYHGHWRWMLGVVAIPAVGLFVGVLFLPRSPRWLMLRNRRSEAREVMARFDGDKDRVERDLDAIKKATDMPKESTCSVLANRHFRQAAFLGILLQFFQQMTGINVVMYYAPKIFEQAGWSNPTEQMWATVIVGVTNVLATFIAILFCDRFGRKIILYVGCCVMAASMGLLGGLFQMDFAAHPALPYLSIAAVISFIIGFAMSAGPLVWVICSEIYPLAGRELGITLSTATNWLCNAVVGATFLTMLRVFGNSATFWLFTAANVLFLLTVWRLCPETKGVTLEKIEENLFAGKKLRELGQH